MFGYCWCLRVVFGVGCDVFADCVFMVGAYMCVLMAEKCRDFRL